jgi:hypothetical protein
VTNAQNYDIKQEITQHFKLINERPHRRASETMRWSLFAARFISNTFVGKNIVLVKHPGSNLLIALLYNYLDVIIKLRGPFSTLR